MIQSNQFDIVSLNYNLLLRILIEIVVIQQRIKFYLRMHLFVNIFILFFFCIQIHIVNILILSLFFCLL